MENHLPQLHFLGAAGTVTGSKFLLKSKDKTILVDCGLFQGVKSLRKKNWGHLPVNVEEIDLVLLTHGHLDHCGYLPRLVKLGFRGEILATEPTLGIVEIILKDSAKIQEEEAKRANQGHYTKHSPAFPLYGIEDVEKTMPLFRAVNEGEWKILSDEIKVRFNYNGHIIGASFIELVISGQHFVFSGDIGRGNDLLLHDPKKPTRADYLFLESTYGNRLHPNENIEESLYQLITDNLSQSGNLLIPTFAVERSQLLMYMLWKLQKEKKIPQIPIYLDTPMGANVLNIFMQYFDWHKLSKSDCQEMCESIEVIQDFRDSLALSKDEGAKIVLAGSGMLTGGRILTYLQTSLSKKSTTILLVGYQAEGTRGRQLLDGAHELKIYGRYYPVRARVEVLHSLSAHADQNDLIEWLSEIESEPKRLFIVHGEPQAADSLRVKIQDSYGWNCEIPELYEIQEL